MTEDNVAAIVGKLTDNDQALFRAARTYQSGIWLGGPCKHLYPDNLCRLTGELTDFGLAVRQHLLSSKGDGR